MSPALRQAKPQLRRVLVSLTLLVLVALLLRAPGHAATPVPVPDGVPPAAVPARVTHITDGDTIRVRLGGATYRVRYIGMDTPERTDPCFEEATDFNAELVEGTTVWLEKDVSEVDRFGRLLRHIWTEDGVLVNEALVREGMAVVYTWPPDVKYEARLIRAQRTARVLGTGCLWE